MTQDTAYHFHIVRRAIDAIDHADAPMPLEDLAAQTGLSPAHFQRVFTRWAGVSPKRFQQYLTLGHAKELLRAHHTTLATAHETGLSGTGRLHDLFLTWEAMSPGAYAQKGAGLGITYGFGESPFGEVIATTTAQGLCGLGFCHEIGREAALADMVSRWPKADFIHDDAAVAPHIQRAFDAKTPSHLHLIGAPFQIKVWEALMQIPSGQVTTYSDIATRIGAPKAVRAVGTAVGRNPISWLIPCHRAMRKSGGLGGYHWGLPIKRGMLAYETLFAQNGDGPNGETNG